MKIGVIGLGYVGLPLAVEFAEAGHDVVGLESTTYPGTTRELIAERLEQSGMRAGTDFHLAFSPERIDPGRCRRPTSLSCRESPRPARRSDRGTARPRPAGSAPPRTPR